MDFEKITKLVLPENTKIEKADSSPSLTLHMEKTIGFYGE